MLLNQPPRFVAKVRELAVDSMNEHVLEFSLKQLEFIRNATHRWNGKIGATQCGKTYIDVTRHT